MARNTAPLADSALSPCGAQCVRASIGME